MELFKSKETFSKTIYVMIIFLFFFQIIDVYGTVFGIENGLEEKNPLMRNIIENHENPYLFLMASKTSGVFIMFLLFQWWKNTNAYDYKFPRNLLLITSFIVFKIYFLQTLIHIYNFMVI